MNADDFGASETTNQAVILAHREGVLTSASLMVNEPATSPAVELARDNPSLAIGLHLVLSDGLSALPSPQIPSLADSSGRFRASPALAGIRMFFLPAARRQARKEIAEQFRRFAATGLPFSHVDGHQHLHVHPVVWDEAVRLAVEHGAHGIRIPYEGRYEGSRRLAKALTPNPAFERGICEGSRRLSNIGGEGGVSSPAPGGRRIEQAFFGALRRRCLRKLRGKNLLVADHVYGHLATGNMSEVYLVELLSRLGGRVNEIYLHPGTPHATPLPGATGMDVELHALLSPEVRQKIEQLGIVLTTWNSAGGWAISIPS